jgi:uncharacterized coiled-coil protein SlyX
MEPRPQAPTARQQPDPTPAGRILELEIKLSFLEKHVEEQDRAMLSYYRQIERLEREVKRLAETVATGGARRESGATGEDRLWENERPPHY